MAKTFRNFIGGSWTEPRNGAYFENRNPADSSDLIGRFCGAVQDATYAARVGTGGAAS